jgi:hypothetical protein
MALMTGPGARDIRKLEPAPARGAAIAASVYR